MSLSTRGERICLAILLSIFACFTWRGLHMFFSGDDVMNMYGAWNLNPWTLGKSLLFIWMPVYRPLGGAVYRVFYSLFGFHNMPLYVVCWLMLVGNALLSYRLFRILGLTAGAALTALSLTLVHGNFQDLYLSAGTIYDRLWFLFTVLGLIVYVRQRRAETSTITLRSSVLLCILSLLSMDSKESGVALPALLFCYEAIFVLPGVWRSKTLRSWLRQMLPFYAVLTAMSLVFVFMRVGRTPELTGTGAYHAKASIALWLTRVAGYLTALSYGHLPVSTPAAALLALSSAAVALWLRNKAMIFGWLFFVITITPVALIAARPGYVLYVPDIGLGLYAATALSLMPVRWPRGELTVFCTITLAMIVFHALNWPGPFLREASPEWRFAEQFRREYAKFPGGTKLLFVTDDFPPSAWDLLFTIRLLYHDQSIVVHRLQAPKDQQADPAHPVEYDHVFTAADGRYVELDNRNVAESVRLHLLRDYAAGREMDFGRRDHIAYIVSGVYDFAGGDPSRWTRGHARLKFDVYPAPATFSAKFWVPDFVAKPTVRTMSVLVNGHSVGEFPLTHDGMNEIHFPVAAGEATLNGLTFVDLNVDRPYKNVGGEDFGVVLLRAGFEYREENH